MRPLRVNHGSNDVSQSNRLVIEQDQLLTQPTGAVMAQDGAQVEQPLWVN